MEKKVILITGAAGFIGQATVSQACKRGFQVRAMVRSSASIPQHWAQNSAITPLICDLSKDEIDLGGVDVIIHAAASLDGDDGVQARDTIAATKALLRAMEIPKIPPELVLLSSISVYDSMSLPIGTVLDEASPIEKNPTERDAYCRAKIGQEVLVKESAKAAGFPLTILRAGAVYGEDHVWNDHIGISLGPLLLRGPKRGQVPVCTVKHCAATLVRAVELGPPENAITVVNVLDDDLPNRTRFVQVLRSGGWPKWVLPFPWRVLDSVAIGLHMLPFAQGRLPGLLRRPVLHARLKPLKYSNARLQSLYGIESEFWFETAMLQALDPNVFEPKNG